MSKFIFFAELLLLTFDLQLAQTSDIWRNWLRYLEELTEIFGGTYLDKVKIGCNVRFQNTLIFYKIHWFLQIFYESSLRRWVHRTYQRSYINSFKLWCLGKTQIQPCLSIDSILKYPIFWLLATNLGTPFKAPKNVGTQPMKMQYYKVITNNEK